MNIKLGGAMFAPSNTIYKIGFVKNLVKNYSNAGNQAGPVLFTNICLLIVIIVLAVVRARIENKKANDFSFDASDFDDISDDDFDF